MRETSELDVAISAVCPISGVSVGRKNDRATWRIDFLPEATEAQRAAAQAVADAFDFSGEPVPASVKMWQAKAKLAEVGKLAAADAAVAAAGAAVQFAWQNAPDISRNSDAVKSLGLALGMTSADLDALFIAAAAIKV